MTTRVALVPPVLALLPRYAGLVDPVAPLRAVALDAVAWLGAEVTVLGDAQAQRVAAHLLGSTRRTGRDPSYLVLGNGSARRTDVAPGPYDARAVPFDEELGGALRAGDAAALAALDRDLARELWAGVDAIAGLGRLGELGEPEVDYDDAPFGVQYWVMRWTCGS